MSRRNPYPVRTSPAEAAGDLKPIWRSLEEKGRSAEERTQRAETEAEGEGFVADMPGDVVDASALSRGINRFLVSGARPGGQAFAREKVR
jgi:hypothetical protein